MTSKWIGFLLPLALLLFYVYKIYYKKEKTASNGFMVGIMLIIMILSLGRLLAMYVHL